MLLECKVCDRVKKFGEWIDTSLEFRALVRETGVDVIHVVCPHCEEEALMASAERPLMSAVLSSAGASRE
ncbi:MAG TPA: hypothetical protein ACFYED_00360 [Candidatus Tripitaka californicus]|uniref:hypothetical protein n=1 Tax=Candidatus Tripitaka californicus TaxID=3367616 RepID=UPI004029EEF8|nr:hypothetical protein [Planctomycetota bacterium]